MTSRTSQREGDRPASPTYRRSMPLADWAEQLARRLLEEPSPRRWQHTRGVAHIARTLAPILGPDADLLHASA